jgi:membrane protease YdiL (CAAX protease family)
MNHPMKFLRSVLPADLTQLLFLSGIVCLVISPRLGWWPVGLISTANDHHLEELVERAHAVISFSLWPIIFSGIAGYLICFRPGRRPVRRILWLVFAPAIAGVGLISGQILAVSRATSSILEVTGQVAGKAGWLHWIPGKLPAGIHFCLAGLLLIAIYTSRLAFGIAQLPLSLPGAPYGETGDAEQLRRLQFLIWVLVGPLFLLYSLFTFVTLLLPAAFTSRLPFYSQSAWFSRLSPVLGALFVFAILLWIMGKESRQVILNTIWLPEPRYAALGLAFPIGIAVLLSTGQYLVDRSQWAAHDFGRFSPPQFRTYFDLPDPWLLLTFFAALFEEMIFRGLLQRRFVQRYGIYRGIFLVGMVWAGFHFVSDVSFSRLTETDVLLKLTWRILFCLALSYVLGWLMLRFGSILPAAIAHTFYNILVMSGFGPSFIGKDTVLVTLWAVLAWALFRYWPIQAEVIPEATVAAPSPEPVA